LVLGRLPEPARPSAARIELVDALRAFALFGILQVNIQSFVWGAGDPLGYFRTSASLADAAIYIAIGTLVSGKFMSIFAFLFGLGFALQWRGLVRRVGVASAGVIYRRRLRFLLAVGIAHGVFFYYGDILAFYALCGFVMLRFALARPARLARSVRNAWVLAVVWVLGGLGLWELGRRFAGGDELVAVPAEALQRFAVYTEAGYLEQLFVRVEDFVTLSISMLATSVFHVLALFLLGTLAGRLGWLAHPRVWRVAIWIGLVAAPLALAGAWINFVEMRDRPGNPGGVGYLLQFVGSALACLYVALAARWRARRCMRSAIAWLAPAGRMPLTNYLVQSVLMGLLLSGWGLGLGAVLGRAQLAALGLAIVVMQVFASRAWIARYEQGPLEASWRAWTYRGIPDAGSATASTFNQTPR